MSRTNKIPFREMDKEPQLAMILLPLAWVVFLSGQAMTDGTISLVQLGMGGLCCMLVFSFSNWGLWFSGAYNIVLVASIYWQGGETVKLPLVTIAATLFFAGATIALFMPRTRALFRKNSTKVPDKGSSTTR